MSDQRIPISQLSETQTAPDASYIAIDDGSLTKKITVENFNSTSTASAQQYANQAAASAQTVEDNIATSAAQIREATLAAREATQASTAATASATSAYDSATLAQNYSANASTSAGQAMNAADSAAQNLTASKRYAEDSEAWAVGKRNGSDVPASDETYQNNAKYYANSASGSATRAETAAQSINAPDTTLTVSGVAAESKATGDRISSVNAELVDIRVKADGTTAATAGDAVREQVGDLKSAFDSVTFDKVGTNINNCGYEGGYMASNGTDTTASSFESVSFRSNGYISVVGGKTVYWWGKLSDGTALGANAVIVEYDSQKNLIGQRHPFNKYGTTADNQAFTTSENAAYVRIALYQEVEDKSTIQIALYYSGDEQESFILYQSDKALNYNKVYTADGDSLDDAIDDKIAAIGLSPIYELQPISVTGESGALMSDGSVRETTDVTRYKIPVLAGEKYVVSARHGYGYRAFLVLDSDNNILSYFPTITSVTAIHRNVEVNIAEDGFLVVQDVYNFPPYIGKAVSVDFNDKLYKKSIYWNGDSICFGAGGFSFANQIGLIHAMPETMDAVSGTRLSTRTGRTDSIYDRVVAMDTTAEYDFIGIEGGYNDYFSSVTIGTLMTNYTDLPDTTTVIGAVEGICKHIRTNFPNSKFFFVLGHRPIAVGAYPTEVDTYWDAIISALEKWAVPYVDIRKEGTLMAYNADWLADYFGQGETMGTHPNTEGYTKFYNPLVEDRMKSL